jgi:adenylate cyclase
MFGIGGPTSIRWSLLRSFVVLILISSLTVLVLMSIRASRTEKELSAQLIKRGTHQVVGELERFFQPVVGGVQIAVQWGRADLLDLSAVVRGKPGVVALEQINAAARLNALFLPYLLANPQLSSVQIANDRGDGFLILELPGGQIQNRVVSPQKWQKQTLWFTVSKDGTPLSSEWKNVDYDPRSRAWYVGCERLDDGRIFWTAPYIFFTTKDLGITASARWQTDNGDYFVAYDVLLTAITEFTQNESAQVSANGQIVIVTDNRRLIGLPRDPRFKDSEIARKSFLLPAGEVGVPELTAALQAVEGRGPTEKGLFQYRSGNESWWAGLQLFSLADSLRLWIGVLVPDKDLLEGVRQQRIYLLIGTLITLAAALLYSLLLARSYSRPLEALAAQSRRIQDLDFRSDEKIDAKLREFKQLAQAQAQSLAALQSFARYVPVDVVRELMAKGEVAQIGGRRETVTVLFMDIAGFTTIAENLSPEALTSHMAAYFQAMIEILQTHGATVDKLVGDAIMAFWGAPAAVADHSILALKAVSECRRQLDILNPRWLTEGRPALPTRFGLAAGSVVVGNIGAPSRLAYTVLGDPVNLASRLQGLNNTYGTTVLVDESVRVAGSRLYEWRHIDRIIVKGKTHATDIFELLGEAGSVSATSLEAARRYELAWDQYRSGKFQQTLIRLEENPAEFIQDRATQRLRELCRQYLKTPPSEDWNGVTKMDRK